MKKLREWFVKNAAELPWRPADLNAMRDPYAVWISETMLQQTQVSTVKDYFIRWMKRFPDIETLAKADEPEVFKYWQGLGYYSRARNILKTAKIVSKIKDEKGDSVPVPRIISTKQQSCKWLLRTESGKTSPCGMPETRKELEALPGIGAYTAGAILSLAYHKREAILDGNLVRIFSRLHELDFLPTDKVPKGATEIYWNYAREIADSPKAYMHNEALMELGRTVCKIKSPLCENCPLAASCKSFADGRTAEFPPAKKRTEKSWHGTALVIESADEKILAVIGGQKFLDGQLALPHFESTRGSTLGLPAKAEEYINADEVDEIDYRGMFRHNITVHKIECDILYVKLKTKSSKAHLPKQNKADAHSTFEWIEKAKAFETFANSFSLKALKKVISSV